MRDQAIRFVVTANRRLDHHLAESGASRFFAFKRWSIENWLEGYKFGPVRRCRLCGHTTPYHYPTCASSERAGVSP